MSKKKGSKKIICQQCGSDQTYRSGYSENGKQRFYCRKCRRYRYLGSGRKSSEKSVPDLPGGGVTPSQSRLALELQSIAQKIGRPPTTVDIRRLSREGRSSSIHTYYKAFETFSEALRKARLIAPDDPELERKSLLGELRDLRAKLKRPLSETDVVAARKKGKVSSIYKFEKMFGSVPKALAAAGAGIKHTYSREELIKILRQIAREKETPVTITDIKRWHKAGRSPSHRSFQRMFGGIVKARLAAGVLNVYRKDMGPSRRWQKYTLEELILQLRNLGEKLGRKPIYGEINDASKRGECASATTFRRAFGSIANAYRRAGFENVRAHTYTDREILDALRKLIREKGDMPTYREITAASLKGLCPTPKTIVRRLGNLSDLKETLNL